MAGNPIDELEKYPGMTHWFDPVLLSKLLLKVIVAGLFGQYADRRLLMAALDTVGSDELVKRAGIPGVIPEQGPFWIDYVSDLGDGFDATYAVAYRLAQESVAAGGEELPRGSLLVMGGDEVYPTSERHVYRARLFRPYRLAFPDRKDAPSHPLVFMIPGNHDWYDGLVQFLALFCREKATRLGNWRTRQRRSYFAIKLRPNWWLWAIDIALTEDMDQPQAEYFVAIAKAMDQHANIILCTAEPGWYGAEAKTDAFRTLRYAAGIAKNEGKDFKVAAVLSGDTHHYARYSSEFGTEFVTSGGGGAFLHGTHGLKDTISLEPSFTDENSTLSLRTRYPGPDESRKLLWGNLLFPAKNWDFSLLLGIIYWLLGFYLVARPRWDAHIIVYLVLAAGLTAYTYFQERTWRAILLSLVHALAHFGAVAGLAWLFARLNAALVEPAGWGSFFLLMPEMIAAGELAGGFIFGLNLLLTCRFLDMNHNDAFSAMRLDSHRHFLRMKIDGDELTIYPIGLDRVPARNEWKESSPTAVGSKLEPPDRPEFQPRLIEPPIVVRMHRVPPVTSTVDADVVASKDPAG